MRITQNIIMNNMRSLMQSNSASLLKAEEMVATQKRFNRLSENPIDGGRVLDLTGAIARSEQYLKNIGRAKAQTEVQDGTLAQVTTIVGRAKELLLGEANQATSTATTREAARLEIAQLTTQLVQAANTRFDGKYIFSGFATDTPAFSDAAVNVTPAAIAGRAAVSGQAVTDSTMAVYHTYQIQFTGAGQYDIMDTTAGATVASNQTYTSWAAIQFEGIELTLSDGPGAPVAGDTFTITATPPGTYQGDGQLQLVEVQPGTRVQQNIPGNRVFSGTGIGDGVDIFAVMNQINEALRTNDSTAINDLLGQLDTAQAQISTERASVGGRANLLDAVKERQSDTQTDLELLRGNLEDADLAEAMVQLNNRQTVYEATLSAAAQIVQPSLLDFLR